MMWDGHDGMGWWMLWGSVLWLVLILAAVYLAVWLSRQAGGGRQDGPPPASSAHRETPLDIVRRRYAAGEISREEFEQLRKDLQ